MIRNLPKYYTLATISGVDEALLEKRSSAISAIVDSKDISFIFECVRFYLNKPLKGKTFLNDLYHSVNEFDSMFLEEGGELEKKIIAGAIVSESISKRPDARKVAGAVVCGIFGMDLSKVLNTEIITEAIEFLNSEATNVRQVTSVSKPSVKLPAAPKPETLSLEVLLDSQKNLLAYLKSQLAYSEEKIAELDNELCVLKEESDIHWWLFRSYSDLMQCSVSKLQAKQAIFILSSELCDLISKVPQPENTESFLKKVWSDVKESTKQVLFTEVIQEGYSLKEKYTDRSAELEPFTNLSPINYALSKCHEADGDESWNRAFSKNSGFSADLKLTPYEFGQQFLTELLLSYY